MSAEGSEVEGRAAAEHLWHSESARDCQIGAQSFAVSCDAVDLQGCSRGYAERDMPIDFCVVDSYVRSGACHDGSDGSRETQGRSLCKHLQACRVAVVSQQRIAVREGSIVEGARWRYPYMPVAETAFYVLHARLCPRRDNLRCDRFGPHLADAARVMRGGHEVRKLQCDAQEGHVRFHPVHLRFLQRGAEAGARGFPVGAEGQDLRDHRIEARRHHGADVQPVIDAKIARCFGQCEARDKPGRRPEVPRGIFCVQPGLHGPAVDGRLVKECRLAVA